MDIGRAKGWRTGPAQGNAVAPVESNATQPPRTSKAPPRSTKFQGKCWHCDTPGHTRKECRKLQRETAASTSWERTQQTDWQPANDESSNDGPNPIDCIIKSFAALSSEEQDELAARFQQNEDFIEA